MLKLMLKTLVSSGLMLTSLTGYCLDWGVIVADHYNCNGEGSSDRIVIETPRGYTNAQVYSGYSDTLEGNVIGGELYSYGFTDIYDKTGQEVGRLWIDDYMSGKSSAQEWCWAQ